jgi:hypothetical protein
VGDRFNGHVLGAEPVAAWTSATAQRCRQSTRTVRWAGSSTCRSATFRAGREYVMQLFADHLVHAWDLVRAIGASERCCQREHVKHDDYLTPTVSFCSVRLPGATAIGFIVWAN